MSVHFGTKETGKCLVLSQNVNCTIKEKLDILNILGCGMKAVDVYKLHNLSPSTLSSWKKQKSKLENMVGSGKVLNTKRNHDSFLPQVERALHLWFHEKRSGAHEPSLNRQILAEKST